MKILGILKNKFTKEDLVNFQGKILPYKNLCVLNFVETFKSFGNTKIIYEDDLHHQKNLKSFLNFFDICIIFSLKNKYIIEAKKFIKTNFLILEAPFIFRKINKPLKDQHYIRVMWNNHLGQDYIKKYSTRKIRENFNKIKILQNNTIRPNYLIINQMENDSAIVPTDPYEWIKKTVDRIREISNKKIIIREHPLQKKNKPQKIDKIILENNFENCFSSQNDDIYNDLKDTAFCITFSSGAAIEAMIAGVPVYAEDNRSCVFEISSHNLKYKKFINENDKLNISSALSNTHWSLKEITDGICWNFFKKHFKYN